MTEYFSGIAASMKDQIGAKMTFDPGGNKKFLARSPYFGVQLLKLKYTK